MNEDSKNTKWQYKTVRAEWHGYIISAKNGDLNYYGPYPTERIAEETLKGFTKEGDKISVFLQEAVVEIDPLVKEIQEQLLQMVTDSANNYNCVIQKKNLTQAKVTSRVRDYISGLARRMSNVIETDQELQ